MNRQIAKIFSILKLFIRVGHCNIRFMSLYICQKHRIHNDKSKP